MSKKVKKAVLGKGLEFPKTAKKAETPKSTSKPSPVEKAAANPAANPAPQKKSYKNLFPVENPQLLPSFPCQPKGDGMKLVQLLKKPEKLEPVTSISLSGTQAFYRGGGVIHRMDTDVYTPEQTYAMLTDVLLPEQKEKLLKIYN